MMYDESSKFNLDSFCLLWQRKDTKDHTAINHKIRIKEIIPTWQLRARYKSDWQTSAQPLVSFSPTCRWKPSRRWKRRSRTAPPTWALVWPEAHIGTAIPPSFLSSGQKKSRVWIGATLRLEKKKDTPYRLNSPRRSSELWWLATMMQGPSICRLSTFWIFIFRRNNFIRLIIKILATLENKEFWFVLHRGTSTI